MATLVTLYAKNTQTGLYWDGEAFKADDYDMAMPLPSDVYAICLKHTWRNVEIVDEFYVLREMESANRLQNFW